ncbi:unnamed protein product, partial [Medioppia subpectinata]
DCHTVCGTGEVDMVNNTYAINGGQTLSSVSTTRLVSALNSLTDNNCVHKGSNALIICTLDVQSLTNMLCDREANPERTTRTNWSDRKITIRPTLPLALLLTMIILSMLTTDEDTCPPEVCLEYLSIKPLLQYYTYISKMWSKLSLHILLIQNHNNHKQRVAVRAVFAGTHHLHENKSNYNIYYTHE